MAQQKQDEYIKHLASKVDVLTTRNKMLEAQIVQQASSSPTFRRGLPSKLGLSLREHCNYVMLRSRLEDPKGFSIEEDGEVNHHES